MSRHPQDATATRMLADRTGTDPADWFLVFKARYGMEVVFRALAEARGPGDVVTQVFTCSTAVDPVLVAGLRPVYAEVSPATVAIDPDRLAVGPGTRAVVLQNTFGIVDEPAARRLRDAARSVGALLVEDSAHCVGRLARDADGTPVADVSFHSFGVEKLLPTRFGGAVWVSPALDPALRAATVAALDALPVVGPRLDLAARSFRTQVRVLNRLPGAAAGKVRGALTAVGAYEPAIAPVENRGGLAHPPQRPSAWVVDRMVDALRSSGDTEARRADTVAEYVRGLSGVVEVPAGIGERAPLVRFPFFAPDAATADRLVAELTAAGFYVGKWYRPALFPGPDDPAVYGYTPGDPALATTEDLVARVVNLPTTVGVATARRLVEAVRSALGA
ncbi:MULTISPECIES: DegT/DnrJ/EryC1/StrS family aminotransferase [Cellulosimicrobium]|uniref:DegT/DnrJ/EryC1/StrS family aminotransferase n=1 Tax=Cellulosimicrobium TaxID=157920 RepID=UPI001459CE0D|nr:MULTISPECIES: DegT/DnrJ/EryC1/StrS family aminotransferase [Cellulosimicrobium]MCM3535644.1 DegT/DnrJ/EryC1/StrS family aminotransferase [Cellulosimicrobium funkei]NMF28608.1 DegT/DnrJ/EryC1/StrS aminotransferase family protein [Cellulosimicrobium aquatile]